MHESMSLDSGTQFCFVSICIANTMFYLGWKEQSFLSLKIEIVYN